MARYHGKVGFGASVEDRPGVWVDSILERSYFGDVLRDMRLVSAGDQLNDDIRISNSISIVADAYALANISAIRYVEWMGQLWTINNVTLQAPRLLFQLGEVYNGPTAAAPITP